jgi:N-acyl-D-amino-acid deacylase
MLLQHRGGWDIDELGYDPMFEPVKIAHAEDEPPPASAETIIQYMLRRELNFDPGTRYAYSNFGYNVLGRIIEEVTGESYGSYVSNRVLDEMQISRMSLGKTRLENRIADEVRYYGNEKADSVFPDEGSVPSPYGGFYLQCIDAHGGWVGSTIDILRFITHIDRRGPIKDVLQSDTLEIMTQRPDIPHWKGSDSYYAMGWNVRPEPQNWWHYGSLPGSTSILVRTNHEDLSWAALFNSRPPDWNKFNQEVDKTLWDAIRSVSEWPAHDLFKEFD